MPSVLMCPPIQSRGLVHAADAPLRNRDEHIHWFAVAVAARHEKAVSQLLGNKGYETFLPLYRRRHQYARSVRKFDVPLFPGYLFCRLDVRVRLPVLTTPGVLRLVGAGRAPIPVDDSEVTSLQTACYSGFPLRPCPWKNGRPCVITDGALAGIQGIVIDSKGPLRVILSISLLQRSVLVEIDSALVKPADAHSISGCAAYSLEAPR